MITDNPTPTPPLATVSPDPAIEREAMLTARIAELRATIAGLDEAAAMPRWVACSERMPDKEGEYLCAAPQNDRWIILTGRWFNDGLGFEHKEYKITITHWQPMPPSPTTKETP